MSVAKKAVDPFSDVPPHFRSGRGAAYLGDARDLLAKVPANSVDLLLTSPPYALHFKKEYGNVDQDRYVEWLLEFAPDIRRVLKPTGSFVLNIGGSWTPGAPTRSLCHFEIALRLVKECRFHLAQEFFWYNPAKLPAPAEWVNVRKIRVKDSVECVWWFSKEPFPKADNQAVLQPYSPDMLRLLKNGYRAKTRPSGHVITSKFVDRGGSIPGNLLTIGNNDANSRYFVRCDETGNKPHPARFPPQLPAFFIRFLTDRDDLVLDPFAGSCTTGEVAENLGRRWIAFERSAEYLETAKFRFEAPWDDDRRGLITGGDRESPDQMPLFEI
ncbi:MAG: site-specific DNA-methyltransferase [Deltaproteobacteria bacterium]|nr:site-specific DNA-methyltransferase [Deltaproteobacteria bacterium]